MDHITAHFNIVAVLKPVKLELKITIFLYTVKTNIVYNKNFSSKYIVYCRCKNMLELDFHLS